MKRPMGAQPDEATITRASAGPCNRPPTPDEIPGVPSLTSLPLPRAAFFPALVGSLDRMATPG
jgi:hypothetical protein